MESIGFTCKKNIEIVAALRYLDWIDAPHTQNFEIFKSLEQTQEKNKNSLESFVKIVETQEKNKTVLNFL
jgi:hypothetical protein